MERNYLLLFFTFSFIALILTEVTNSQLDNSNQHDAENCTLLNNQLGVCTQFKNCEYARKLSIKGQSNKIQQCGRNNYVCCLQPKMTQTLPTEYPKSIKFKEALCENKISQPPVALNLLGGEEADVGEFPFYVSLGYEVHNKIEYLCGGSLIADDIVITAAHCVNSRRFSPVTVKLGRVSLVNNDFDYGDGEDIKVQSFKIHPNYYRKSRQNDIAIIKLKYPTKFGWSIKTACLSPFNELSLPRNLTILGYGKSYMNILKASDWLLKSKVSRYSFEECEKYMNQIDRKLADDQICAIGLNSCHGDSGSPLTYKYNNIDYIHGVMSYRTGCQSDNPAVYTKLNEHFHWIDNEMFEFEKSEEEIETF